MPQSLRYDSTAAIPPHLDAQVRSLLDSEWPDPEERDTAQPLTDAKLHPTYFILADEDQVLSYARTIWAMVPHLGQTFKLYGLGDVVTDPEFRRRGYGRRIVEEATIHIKSDRKSDAALLLTQPALKDFYRQIGWEYVPGLRVLTGEYGECGIEVTVPLMMFLSPRAYALREVFTEDALVLPGGEW